jgi:hypothetical protein
MLASLIDDYHVRDAVFKRITDQQILAGIAVNNDDFLVREKALETLHDQSALALVAAKDEKPWIRLKAAIKLDDQAGVQDLYRQAAKSKDYVQIAAKHLQDQTDLVDIVINTRDYDAQGIALKRLVDQNLLVKLVKDIDGRTPYVNRILENAIPKIDNEENLVGIREFAVTHKNYPLLKEVTKHLFNLSSRPVIKNEALSKERNLEESDVQDENDQVTLAYIAINANSNHVSHYATQKLTDDELLKTVAISTGWGETRQTAIRQIKNRETLSYFTTDEWPGEIRNEAIKKLQG